MDLNAVRNRTRIVRLRAHLDTMHSGIAVPGKAPADCNAEVIFGSLKIQLHLGSPASTITFPLAAYPKAGFDDC